MPRNSVSSSPNPSGDESPKREFIPWNIRGGGGVSYSTHQCLSTTRNETMRFAPIAMLAGGTAVAALTAAMPARRGEPRPITAALSEWTIRLSDASVPAGPVVFTVTNGGSIPHAFEVEGRGTERKTGLIQPG